MKDRGNKMENGMRTLIRSLRHPDQAASSAPRIALVGQTEMTVENAKGILEYDEQFIKLFLGENSMVVEGRDLRIDMFSEKTIIIRGRICSMSFV